MYTVHVVSIYMWSRNNGIHKYRLEGAWNVMLNRIQSFIKISWSRPLALRGHVTDAFFKEWVGILLMPKIDRAHTNCLTPEIWEETHSIQIFYGTLVFQQSSIINFVLAAIFMEGILLPPNMAAKTTFCLYLVKRLIIMHRYAENATTWSFQQFPWSLSAKFLFRKR